MKNETETIELDLNDWSKDQLIKLIQYSVKNELTIEQSIDRKLIISLIKNDSSFKPEKVECTYCGTMFYGDVFSRCSHCVEQYDKTDSGLIDIFDALNDVYPLWMLIDETTGEYLR